jgi:hypothetical protein
MAEIGGVRRKSFSFNEDGSLDYRWRKSVACVGNLSHSTTNTGRQADRRVNVTMPKILSHEFLPLKIEVGLPPIRKP